MGCGREDHNAALGPRLFGRSLQVVQQQVREQEMTCGGQGLR